VQQQVLAVFGHEYLAFLRRRFSLSILTFVVAGGGFAGVETIGSIHDYLKEAIL
jgi:NADH dehydrogenase FAD-containing subunit